MHEPTVLLAYLDSGVHVQVGQAREHAAAHDLFERLDSEVSGFVRRDGKLRHDPSNMRDHFYGGEPVRFYRLRQVGHEFGDLKVYPVSAKRYSNNPRKGNSTTMTSKTRTGIKRPESTSFSSWEAARQHARNLNESKGRGYRALRTSTGTGYGVIFRPAVAINKQRRTREVV